MKKIRENKKSKRQRRRERFLKIKMSRIELEQDTLEMVRKYAQNHNLTNGKAVVDLLRKGIKILEDRDKELEKNMEKFEELDFGE
jgi:hypothetical protein